MATNLRILGWTSEGLRCPDHSLSFEHGEDVHKVSLVQMPNGTGKTTTLTLLRAALAGPDAWNYSEPMQSFQKNDKIEKGKFELRLLYNQSRLTIQINFDFSTQKITYYTTTSATGGKEDGFHPPIALKPFLSPQFVRLLVFDGELANNLLDPRQTNAQKAIEDMYQLPLFHLIRKRIEEYWDEQADTVGSKGGEKELSRRKSKVISLKERYEHIKNCFDQDNEKLKKTKIEIDTLEKTFRSQIDKNKQDALNLKEAENELKLAQHNLITKARDTIKILKNPSEISQKIAEGLYSLKESLDKARLPGSAAKEFFEEIAEEKTCICDREIDSNIKEIIKSGAKKYLGSEEINILNAMKTDIRNKFPDGKVTSGKLLNEQITDIIKCQESTDRINQQVDSIRLNAAQNNPEIEEVQSKIKNLNKSLGELEKSMEKYDLQDESDESWNLSIIASRIAKAEDELAISTNTMESKKKKDILNRILEKAFSKSLEALSKQVTNDANEKIKQLIPYNNISIQSIHNSLRLHGKEKGSMGETLSIGYAFLSSLLSNTEQNLPCVVDSPSGSIDLAVRSEIAQLIPKIADQFIAFTISSERQNFVLPLQLATKGDVHFVTLFKKENSALRTKLLNTNIHYDESDDGIWVEGQSYFESVHTDKE